MKISKELEMHIRESFDMQPEEVNDAALRNTLLLARRELQMKKSRPRMEFAGFVLSQIRFSGWKIWIAQAVLFIGIRKFLHIFYGNESLCTPKHIAMMLCGFSILLALSAMPFLYRSFRYQMAEIETATRFSIIRLLLAKLIIIGAGDAAVIGSVIWLTASKTSYSIVSTLLYVALPFLLASLGEICLLRYRMWYSETMVWE